jgi:patatin-related protein
MRAMASGGTMSGLRQPSQGVTAMTQSVRLATTMTGGVSLAIWMGGIAREINLVSQASAWRRKNLRPAQWSAEDQTQRVLELYFDLIDLMDVTVDTDVLSGTSAGGINAALLGYCRAAHCDLGTLRGMWLDMGSLVDLLRDPHDPEIPSLMYGDQRMYNDLSAAIPALLPCKAASQGSRPPSTTVLITTTLMCGETGRFTDSYGTLVQDVNHRGLFTFTEQDLNCATAPALALAGRSTASFPAAFEPSFVPFDEPAPQTKLVRARPSMSDYANITRDHWVADGGLLDNQPLDVMLERIFDRRSRGPVRRVLLFVTPSAGPSAETLPPPPIDDLAQPFGLVDGLLKDLGAVLSQSVATNLRSVHDHTGRITARTEARLQLAALANRLCAAAGPGVRLLTPDVLQDYRAREADILARKVVAALMRQASAWAGENVRTVPAGLRKLPAKWATDLSQPNVEQRCRDAVTTDMLNAGTGPDGRPVPATVPNSVDSLILFGRPAFDEAKAAALAVVRCGYQLARTTADRDGLAALTEAVHACRPEDGGTTHLARVDVDAFVRQELKPEPSEYSTRALADTAVTLARKFDAQRAVTADSWTALGTAFLPSAHGALLRHLHQPEQEQQPTAAAAAGSLAARRQAAAQQLAVYLRYLGLLIDPNEVPAGPRDDAPTDPPVDPPGHAPIETRDDPSLDDATALALRLFDLAATQRAMIPVDAAVDQPLELIQVSADTRTLLDPARQTAASKLTGQQFHHFGAFYKRSWRANDWMWGRLDGAGWLVHLLLDPRRIQTIVDASDASEGDKAAWFIARLESLCGTQLPGATGINIAPTGADPDQLTGDRIRAELAFLDNPALLLPASVPLTALWVAQAWQLHIAAEEIPSIVDAICDPRDSSQPPPQPRRPLRKDRPGAVTKVMRASGTRAVPPRLARSAQPRHRPFLQANRQPGPAASWVHAVQQVAPPAPGTAPSPAAAAGGHQPVPAPGASDIGPIPPDAVPGLLQGCPVPDETFAGNRGTPLMLRTVSKVAATTAGAAGSVRQLPGGIRPALTSLHTVTLAGYRVTNGVAGKLRTLILVGFVALALGVALAIQQTDLFGITGILLTGVGLYIIVIGAWQTSRLLFNAVISVTLTAAVASLALPSVRRWLFGGTSKTDVGVIGRQMPWLGSAWWHPLIVALAVLIAPSLMTIVFDSVRHRQPKPTPAPAPRAGSDSHIGQQ